MMLVGSVGQVTVEMTTNEGPIEALLARAIDTQAELEDEEVEADPT